MINRLASVYICYNSHLIACLGLPMALTACWYVTFELCCVNFNCKQWTIFEIFPPVFFLFCYK